MLSCHFQKMMPLSAIHIGHPEYMCNISIENNWFISIFRSILSNPATREEDIDFMLDEMERLGKDL